jgi:antitoxin component YwqK of YwqJK toxin-antitoxin module
MHTMQLTNTNNISGYIKYKLYIIHIISHEHEPKTTIYNKLYATYITKKFTIINITDILDNKIKQIDYNKEFKLCTNMTYIFNFNFYLLKEIAFNKHFIDDKQYELFQNGYCGIYTEYYNSGILKVSFFHINGIIDGIYTLYNTNGLIDTTCLYTNGRINGTRIEYWGDGKKINKITNYVYDIKDGEEIIYYDNGIIVYKTNYINGIMDGNLEGYHYNGKIKIRSINKVYSYYDYNGHLIR